MPTTSPSKDCGCQDIHENKPQHDDADCNDRDFHEDERQHDDEEEEDEDSDEPQRYGDGLNKVSREFVLDEVLENPTLITADHERRTSGVPDIYRPSAPELPVDDIMSEYPSNLLASLDDVSRKPSASKLSTDDTSTYVYPSISVDDVVRKPSARELPADEYITPRPNIYPSDLPPSLDDVVPKAGAEVRPRTLPPSLSMIERTLRESAANRSPEQETRKRSMINTSADSGFGREAVGEARKRTTSREDSGKASASKSKGLKEVSNCVVTKLRKQFWED